MLKFLDENKEHIKRTMAKFLPIFQKVLKEDGVQGLVEYAYGFVEAMHKQADMASNITCGSGCNFCCYTEIYITTFEARYIMGWMDHTDVTIDEEMLKRQNKPGVWDKKLKYADQKCIMINDRGECSIYDKRPLICRLWNSTSDPKNCDTRDMKDSRTARIVEAWAVQLTLNQMDVDAQMNGKPVLLHEVIFDNLKDIKYVSKSV